MFWRQIPVVVRSEKCEFENLVLRSLLPHRMHLLSPLEFHDSWVEPSSEIQPQLERQSSVAENFVEEEVVPVGAVEEDLEIVVVFDLRTVLRTELLLERWFLVENLFELKLLAFLV